MFGMLKEKNILIFYLVKILIGKTWKVQQAKNGQDNYLAAFLPIIWDNFVFTISACSSLTSYAPRRTWVYSKRDW